jgi:hypothetical protein
MKIDWNEFERGFSDMEKEGGFLTDFLTSRLNRALGNIAPGPRPGITPMLPQMQPSLNLNLGAEKTIFNTPANEVHSIGSPVKGQEKLAGLIDPHVLRSVLTAKAVKGAVNTIAGDDAPNTPEVPEKRVILETKYPEMKKILEDEKTKAYLESLLTEDLNNAS